MKITIEQKALASLLKETCGVVEARNTIPILSNVRLEAIGGMLKATATDLDIQIEAKVPAIIASDGATTVNAHILKGIVGKFAAAALVSIEALETRIIVSSGRSRFELQSLPAEDFPDFSEAAYASTFKAKGTDLANILDKVSFATSTEETRYYLNGVYLHCDSGNLVAVSTDGHRLAKTKMPIDAPAFTGVIVPRKTVAQLVGLLGSDEATVKIAGESVISVESGNWRLVSKLINGEFPDYQRVIPSTKGTTQARVSRAELQAAAERVSAVTSEKTSAIKFTIGGGKMVLDVKSPDTGIASDELICAVEGGEAVICFNGRYVSDLLRAVECEEISMDISGGDLPCLVEAIGDDNSLYVLMPMRVA